MYIKSSHYLLSMVSLSARFQKVLLVGGVLVILYVTAAHIVFRRRLTSGPVEMSIDMVYRYDHTDDFLCVKGYFLNLNNCTNATDQLYFSRPSKDAHLTKSRVQTNSKVDLNAPDMLVFNKYFKANVGSPTICCRDIFDRNVINVDTVCDTKHDQITDSTYVEMAKNCSHFKTSRGYITHSLTQFEKEFPLAFSIIVYTDVEQVERLLRAIYRPQNHYCIHVDQKASANIYNAVEAIASCFDTVFVTSKRFNVQWGTFTVLEPDITCMNELLNKSKTWKYFINLTGQEFPLRTNRELVQILRSFNGSNDVEAIGNGYVMNFLLSIYSYVIKFTSISVY